MLNPLDLSFYPWAVVVHFQCNYFLYNTRDLYWSVGSLGWFCSHNNKRLEQEKIDTATISVKHLVKCIFSKPAWEVCTVHKLHIDLIICLMPIESSSITAVSVIATETKSHRQRFRWQWLARTDRRQRLAVTPHAEVVIIQLTADRWQRRSVSPLPCQTHTGRADRFKTHRRPHTHTHISCFSLRLSQISV